MNNNLLPLHSISNKVLCIYPMINSVTRTIKRSYLERVIESF